jgi:hypothetical protein
VTRHASFLVLLLGVAACASAPAPRSHVIAVGSALPADLDTCINDAFTSMAGGWHMRFDVSMPDGTVMRSNGHLRIQPKEENRWIILRPNHVGTYVPFSEITNYGDGQLESVRLDTVSTIVFQERYTECHPPDASGRFKYVSTLNQGLPDGNHMHVTRTGWGSADYHYSFDVMEGAADPGLYALRTRAGERESPPAN